MRSPFSRFGFLSTAALTGSLVAALACASATPRDLDGARSRGRLVVIAYPTPENPFFRWDPANGPLPAVDRADRFDGVDVEVLRRFAARLGVELWFRRVSEASYRQLIPDLVAGQGDVVAGSFSITDERLARADFSRPYFETRTAIVVRLDSPIAVQADLHGRLAAVIAGTSHEQRLLTIGLTEPQLRRVSNTWASLAAVEEGEVDFAVIESWQALTLPSALRVAFVLPGSERYGFAMRRGSDLKPQLDTLLADLEASGELAAIVARYAETQASASGR